MQPSWLTATPKQIDTQTAQLAEQRQQQLTKPPGSLGRLEECAIRLAGMQGKLCPSLENVRIVVFAADHGIAAENVSAFPQAVTVEMIRNFSRGGAAISVIARNINAKLEVINVGAAADPGPLANVTSRVIAAGTANFRYQAAMSASQLNDALSTGQEAVEHAIQTETQLFIGGEMGIANTTSATALACALLDLPAELLAGPGTGLDHAGIAHKRDIITAAIGHHQSQFTDTYEILRHLGGFEIAALTGSYIACAQAGLPVLVDGFISSVAALVAYRLEPQIAPWLLYSHASAEPGHKQVLQALKAQPLLDLGMRLGEASGAGVTVPLLRLACELHAKMATFAEAEVSSKVEN